MGKGENPAFHGDIWLIKPGRPHLASALMQCAFHGQLVEKLLQGSIDLGSWANYTQAFSSILVNDGKELGAVCMSDEPDHTKSPKYFKQFFGVQAKLSSMWRDAIGV